MFDKFLPYYMGLACLETWKWVLKIGQDPMAGHAIFIAFHKFSFFIQKVIITSLIM